MASEAGSHQAAWETDVRIRIRPGRADSGVKLYVTDHDGGGSREFMANTRFFRYPELFDALVGVLAKGEAERPVRVCIMPLSVGLEAVSFVIAGLRAGLFDRRQVMVEGFDISAKATELAKSAVYPRLFFPDDLSVYSGMLDELPGEFVRVGPVITNKMAVLPAADILHYEAEAPFDVVICLNLLMHMAEPDRPRLVEKLAEITAPGGMLCLNNNQEWPGELVPYYRELAGPGGGFSSMHEDFAGGKGEVVGERPDFAVTDANAMILRKDAA